MKVLKNRITIRVLGALDPNRSGRNWRDILRGHDDLDSCQEQYLEEIMTLLGNDLPCFSFNHNHGAVAFDARPFNRSLGSKIGRDSIASTYASDLYLY